MNNPERDPHPSVSDHPCEVLFREAADAGWTAGDWLTSGPLTDVAVALAVEFAVQAASLYHEAQREAGECPMCGAINTDPWGGVHYNTSVGCCIEPPDREWSPASGDSREQQAEILRGLK